MLTERTKGIPDNCMEQFMFYFLASVPALGAVSIRTVCSEVSPLSKIMYMSEEQLLKAGLNMQQIAGIKAARENVGAIYSTYRRMLESGIRMITWKDKEYPARLKNISAAPAVLFVKGNLPDDQKPAAAIVGSRCATSYGLNMAEYLGEKLAEAGVDIISGLAIGADAAAHRGALKSQGGMTYGILGGGVNVCYPRENYGIYDRIINEKRGGIISEMVPGTNPLKRNFPMRNRIISGLSDVVLIIEAREKSGSLITADAALDQGREVMALPGRITDPLSKGCNSLIKNGAHVITCCEDVLILLGLLRNGEMKVPEKNIELLSAEEKRIIKVLDTAPRYSQDVVDATGLSYQEVCSILLDLELKGYITQVSAGYYGVL